MDFVPKEAPGGFRPERGARQAIEAIRAAIGLKDQYIVIDADIMGFLETSP
jgi:hypothetical protein